MARQLVLFDVDGTLIATNFAGRQVMSMALRDTYGTDGALDSTSFSGKTDLGIIASALQGVLSDSQIEAGLPQAFEAMASRGERAFFEDSLAPCPGVLSLLDRLREESGVLLGLQTGNIRPTALQKLTAAGLDPDWFPIGAFGSDSADRQALFPIAWRRAHKLTGHAFSGHNTIAVGDTPGDISAAQANGAKALAVASGFCAHSELAAHRPDYLLADLSDTEHVLTILTKGVSA